jgi:hypothetical protein
MSTLSHTGLLALLLLATGACGAKDDAKPAPRPSVHGHSPSRPSGSGGTPLLKAEGALPDTAELSALLGRAVEDGRVDYALVHAERAVVDRYLAGAAKADVARHETSEQLAFWCNVYDAGVLVLVLKHVQAGEEGAGARSVREVDGFFAVKELIAGGAMLSLDEIEAKARALGDPRCHLALCRASRSSPPLPSRAWHGASIDADLDAAVKAFLASPAGLQVRDREVWVSKLFETHAKDFGGPPGVRAFVMAQAPLPAREYLDKPVRYLDWDWALNAR